MEQLTIPDLEETASFDSAQEAAVAGKLRWPIVNLGDVCTFTGGGTPDRSNPDFWDGSIPWVSVKDFKTFKIDSAQESITELGLKNSASNLIKAGTIIIPTRMALGKVAVCSVDVAINQDLKAVLIKDESLLSRDFLVYSLFSRANYIESRGKGATVQGVTLDVLRSLEIPLPPLPEQQRIVARLDQAQRLIDQRKEQLTLMDALVQSLFYEMFGDPVKNEKGWEVKSVSSVCSSIMGGGTPSKSNPDYYTGLIPWVTPKDMKVIWINNSIDKITENAISSSSAKLIKTGSVLMVIRSGILKNKLPVAINTVPVTLNQDMKAFVPKKDLLKAEFLLYIFNFFQPVLLGKVRAVTADNIEFSQIKDLLIPIPPLPLQQAFADRVQQIEALKQQMQASLRELEQNFQALMQEAFG
ncbi:restriction endonuclease subunit S [bacterium (Candidatus Blackallbacteria) CG13_big_fil_rev_8_21_14_2_50_49_14]|nr:MAG: restriction endonuclease [bacterium (Candidatus Blackallbacteria) CG18_big_fil_WC_8_21_14_2_50_49_26]PIW49303.1 MAG: restriction endonuclease subunit S [bacterium (Candidatus Blackallbacteria) CG13_big_fil_rev_8_21_14_2_50_49_14]